MRFPRALFIAVTCLFALTLVASAQTRKAGLWQVTSNMTWQQSPFPAGMSHMGGAHTTSVCVTQEQIDKYGTVPPHTQRDCQVTHVVKTSHGMTAEMVCSGHMQGKGTIQASWSDETHATSKVHFTGKMQMGPDSKSFEWTVESTSVYSGPDCGSVKPIEAK
ncbi:MAG TPA: DUF3617 family protein [Terracidiphilus sp.]|nr:DUF3617 family protein [Terracidiphilus sp.]